MARKMTRTMWLENPDGDRVRVVRGEDAPRWYRGRHTDAAQARTAGGHPAAGRTEGGGPWTVPQGSVDKIKGEVGDDPERARMVLEEEQQGQKRSTLIEAMEKVIENAPEEDEPGEDDERTEAVRDFLDRDEAEVVADVETLTEEDRELVAEYEAAGDARPAVLEALGAEPAGG